jgi:transcriptional regulator with XRE-family HTH domain
MERPNFGGELRKLRQQRSLSLKKFAQLVHYDPGYLSKIENDSKPPTTTFAARCDAALGTGARCPRWWPHRWTASHRGSPMRSRCPS